MTGLTKAPLLLSANTDWAIARFIGEGHEALRISAGIGGDR
jgi:hypothetical protein